MFHGDRDNCAALTARIINYCYKANLVYALTEIALPYQSPVTDAFLFMLSNYAVLNFQDDQ